MKSVEFNKIDDTFFKINEKGVNECKKNNISYWNYIGVCLPLLYKYTSISKKIKTIQGLDFTDEIKTRAILNKSNINSKDTELIEANINLINIKNKLFSWLDKTENPFFFILNPVYNYGASLHRDYLYYYIKDHRTGIENIDVACEYAIYKITKS